MGGYPFGFSITLVNAHLAWPNGFGLNGQRVNVVARPWSPSSFKVTATGGFAVNLPPGGARPALTLASETVRGKIAFGDGSLPRAIAVSVDSVSASRTSAEGQSTRELTVATLELTSARPATPPVADTDVGLDLSLHLVDMGSDAFGTALGSTIGDTTLQARLMGKLPVTFDTAGLTAWRDSGASIEIPAFTMRWGPLGLGGNGTLALDTEMQPEAAFTARLTGYDKAIEAMVNAKWIKPGVAGIASIALQVATSPGPDGQPTATVPLTIQAGHLMLGPAKLADMPELKLD